MTLPSSYHEVFQRFDDAGGKWVATWNWAAFVFGIFWYFYRGLWAKAIIYYLVAALLATITGGVLGLVMWFSIGLVANYDLYLLHRKGTQLWDGGGVASDAVPGVTSPISTPSASNAAGRLAALENARRQGVISESEYNQKLTQLELDAEREKKLAALEDMRRTGVLSQMEYEAKKRDIMLDTREAAAQASTGIS